MKQIFLNCRKTDVAAAFAENDILKRSLISRIKLSPQARGASLAVQECSRANSGCRQSQNLHRLHRQRPEKALRKFFPAAVSCRLPAFPKIPEQAGPASFSPWKRQGLLRDLQGTESSCVHPRSTGWGKPCGHNTGGSMSGGKKLEFFWGSLLCVRLNLVWSGHGKSLRRNFDMWGK